MKRIEAIIRKTKFEDVKDALYDAGVTFFSYWDVTGIGNEKKGHVYRGVSYAVCYQLLSMMTLFNLLLMPL